MIVVCEKWGKRRKKKENFSNVNENVCVDELLGCVWIWILVRSRDIET